MTSNPKLSRPLEFRVWHSLSQRMYPMESFTEQFVFLPWLVSKSQSISRCLQRSECVLLQFTGVLDGKGSKIFEGDILYWHHYDTDDHQLQESWHEVVFHNGAFGTMESDGELTTFYDVSIDDVIIGNVFENPHMLPRSSAS